MRPLRLTLLLLGIALLTVLVTAQVFFLDRPVLYSDVREVEYVFEVADTLGFDVESDKLRMGAVREGARSRRSISVEHPSASEVYVRVTGSGRGLLSSEQRSYVLEDGQVEIDFIVEVDDTVPDGLYEGVVVFYFK